VLRDTDPNDADASRALALAIRNMLTPEQVTVIEQVRQEAQARRDQGGVPGFQGPRRGPGGPGGGGPGLGPGAANPQARAELRARARQVLLSRLIRRLERRLQ